MTDDVAPAAPVTADAAPAAANATTNSDPVRAAVEVERQRTVEILRAGRGLKLEAEADRLVAHGTSAPDAIRALFTEAARRDEEQRIVRAPTHVAPGGADFDDPAVLRRSMTDYLASRMLGTAPEGAAARWNGHSIADLGVVLLESAGVRSHQIGGRSRAIDHLLGRGGVGLHTTSDFPLLLADSANKVMLAAYSLAQAGWRSIARVIDVNDFRVLRALRLGEYPELAKVNEHGEFTFGTIGEAQEGIKIETYGRAIGISRQALVNDDLNAFSDLAQRIGRAAADLEGRLTVELIESNPQMAEDGTNLFHVNHGNFVTPGAAIDVTSISLGRAALTTQKGLDGKTVLGLRPVALVVPAQLETVAEQFVATSLSPATTANVIPESLRRLQVVVEPRATSAAAWYLAASQDAARSLTVAYLDGRRAPEIITRQGFITDGVEWRASLDWGVAILDWRGLYKNAGG